MDRGFPSYMNSATEPEPDWQSDWSGKVVVGGSEYYLNGYQKNDGWIAGKLKPVAAKKSADDDEIPFLK